MYVSVLGLIPALIAAGSGHGAGFGIPGLWIAYWGFCVFYAIAGRVFAEFMEDVQAKREQ